MKKLMMSFGCLMLLFGAVPTDLARAAATEDESCCWLYCESYRMICEGSFGEDEEYCQAFYEGCIDGCQYAGGD